MVERWWDELTRKFPHVANDSFVVMPDHIHGIIVIAAPKNVTHASRIVATSSYQTRE